MGTMTLAVMTRATLGHSGQSLRAGPGTAMIYGLVSAAALLRTTCIRSRSSSCPHGS